jgi:hypothetical protein
MFWSIWKTAYLNALKPKEQWIAEEFERVERKPMMFNEFYHWYGVYL